MIAIDFFCGAGGLTKGLLNAGIQVRLGIDANEGCRETYETNNDPSQFLAADVRELRVQDILNIIGRVHPDDLLLAACAPCQPFAQLNRYGTQDGAATLLGQLGRFIQELRPRCIFIENVPGITRVRRASTLNRFLSLLRKSGYSYCESILDAKDYGVPQTRRRYIIIAIRGIQPILPPRTHGPDLIPYETVENAIRGYPPIEAGETHPLIPNHRTASLSAINLERIRHTPLDGGGRIDWPAHLWLDCHLNGHNGHTDVYGRMRWQSVAPTLTCRCHSLSNGRYGHPEQDRAISLREAARLQSFDDDYIFFAPSLGALAAQIGNAVPVQLAETVANHILAIAA